MQNMLIISAICGDRHAGSIPFPGSRRADSHRSATLDLEQVSQQVIMLLIDRCADSHAELARLLAQRGDLDEAEQILRATCFTFTT